MSEMEMNPRREPDRRFLKEALGFLAGEGRHQTAEQLLSRLYARFRETGRGKLADLVYEMTKACLSALPDFSVRTLLRVEPRQPEVISGEMSTLKDCLAGVDDKPDLSAVARRTPAETAALGDARKCLTVLQTLEGDSGRQQLALALFHIHGGQPDQAEPVLRALLERSTEDEEILRIAEVNLAFSLVRQGRYDEVIPVAEAALEKSPDDPVPWFNLIAATSELKDVTRFEAGVRALRELHARTGNALIRSWIEHDLPELGSIVGLGAERVAELTELPDGGRNGS